MVLAIGYDALDADEVPVGFRAGISLEFAVHQFGDPVVPRVVVPGGVIDEDPPGLGHCDAGPLFVRAGDLGQPGSKGSGG